MKKSLKIILIVVGLFTICIIFDIVSIFTRNKPIFAIKDDCDCVDQVYHGILYDTYNCWEYPTPQIKAKWTKFNCIENVNTTLIYGKITDIKDNYIIITTLKSNSSLKINEEAHISLSNNPKINGANNLIIGQYLQIKPKFIEERYPVIITTDKIDIIDKSEIEDNFTNKERFISGHTLNDGRVIHFTFHVPYQQSDLMDAFINNKISINDFVLKLDQITELNDGGSKLYEYNKNTKTFGNENFYIIECNTLNGIKDIFVAKNLETLNNICNLKIDDLDGVSMTIKEGTLTNVGATIIIKDISDRKNIYGDSYEIEKYENEKWTKLVPKNDIAFVSIGYTVDKNNILELNVNWESYYGKLEKGKYRIIKDTSEALEGTQHYITAEFTIE